VKWQLFYTEETLDKVLQRVEKPARYIGNEINSILKEDADIKIVLAFPDVYEVGTSYLGFQILYDLLNKMPQVQAERTFAPWPDMEAALREEGLSLYGLESKRPLAEFDIIGFTLQHELSYTNVLNMLDMAGLKVLNREREGLPLVIAGGPGALNPEPMHQFIDVFIIGEGEEILEDLVQAVRLHWNDKRRLLRALAVIPGFYVPDFYQEDFDSQGRSLGTLPRDSGFPQRIQKRIVSEFGELPLPERWVIPWVQPVHDRVSIEICRGCSRGCRFCQAGMAYRPVRERGKDLLVSQGTRALMAAGSREISLSSLSSADHSQIGELVQEVMSQSVNTSVSLPSLRVDSYSVELAKLTKAVRKTGLTLAPEAGSQRLRDVINKNVTEAQILDAARTAFAGGWTTIKLYFMIGLPTETDEDIEEMARLVWKIRDTCREAVGHTKRFQINLGVATFVPKPHTPFQWFAQTAPDVIESRQHLLKDRLHTKFIKVQTTKKKEGQLEAVLARGDRKISQGIYRAWQLGCRFDSWSEHFRPDLWQKAFEEAGIDPQEYAFRDLPWDAPLPWDHIDIGISKKFLIKEAELARKALLTEDCTFGRCSRCGICKNHHHEPLKRGAGQ
jgi:radical SAM family uncharacterized protein